MPIPLLEGASYLLCFLCIRPIILGLPPPTYSHIPLALALLRIASLQFTVREIAYCRRSCPVFLAPYVVLKRSNYDLFSHELSR